MWDETEIRVRYAETDKMGIVHHSNYYVWFELGRSDYCRNRGFSYLEMEEDQNLLMVVAESYCRYKSPAFYEDVLSVKTRIEKLKSRGIVFEYEVLRKADEKLIAVGKTTHIITDKNKKIQTLPEKYSRMLKFSP